MDGNEKDRIPTNLRTLLILDALGDRSEPASPADLGRHIGLPKPTVHRLCNSLVELGYLSREEKGGFRPGRKAREMASSILHGSTAHIARHQILAALADEIGETVNFVVPEDRGMSYKDRVETNWAFRIQLPIGTHVPFHSTASGKTFLASLRKKERQRLVNTMMLEKYTARTHVGAESLLADLAQISRQGFALDDQEFMDGMIAAAVPILDAQGRYFASLAFHGPEQRVSLERAAELVPILRDAAEKITRALF